MVICGIGALVGLIPIKGYGSLCSERLIYPLSFLFLSILHLVIIFMIRCSIKNEELLQITNDDLKIFYETLVYTEKKKQKKTFFRFIKSKIKKENINEMSQTDNESLLEEKNFED